MGRPVLHWTLDKIQLLIWYNSRGKSNQGPPRTEQLFYHKVIVPVDSGPYTFNTEDNTRGVCVGGCKFLDVTDILNAFECFALTKTYPNNITNHLVGANIL